MGIFLEESLSALNFLLLKGQRRGRYGLFSGLIAIKVGLGALAIWKTGYEGLELWAMVAITEVNSLMEEDEVNDIFWSLRQAI